MIRVTPFFDIHPKFGTGFDIGYIRSDPDSHINFEMGGFPTPKIAFYKPAEGTRVNIAVSCKLMQANSVTVF